MRKLCFATALYLATVSISTTIEAKKPYDQMDPEKRNAEIQRKTRFFNELIEGIRPLPCLYRGKKPDDLLFYLKDFKEYLEERLLAQGFKAEKSRRVVSTKRPIDYWFYVLAAIKVVEVTNPTHPTLAFHNLEQFVTLKGRKAFYRKLNKDKTRPLSKY
ncbi:hypothetical protein Bealeia1_00601 [Candidatus Bealeia paramacronuclearis]|uniref:Uncharacterized protein n=1 Tax=Candidatus Bealeia paramacronuclearis TaxID=1921001 RepID=A0ABZ2C2X9_9PROT|nr:hypothetical protein [Candidatus Bealeia paramacronuclearis]